MIFFKSLAHFEGELMFLEELFLTFGDFFFKAYLMLSRKKICKKSVKFTWVHEIECLYWYWLSIICSPMNSSLDSLKFNDPNTTTVFQKDLIKEQKSS